MNIIEAYVKFNGSFIILVSGMSGSGINTLAKNMGHDLKMKVLTYRDYLNDKIDDARVDLNIDDAKVQVINYDSDGIIDWVRFIDDIVKAKLNGVIAVAPAFSSANVNILPDIHLNIKLSKQK